MSQHYDDQDSVEIAKQTMIGDLVQASIDELKAAPNVWQKLSELKQAEIIERLTARVVHNVVQAIHIIASDDRPVIRASLEQITVKNGVKAVLQLSKNDPSFHDLADATGEEVLVVLPHIEEYAEQDAGVKADPDQPSLPIDEPGLGRNRVIGALEAAVDKDTGETEDPLLENAIELVVSTRKVSISSVQRGLKIGYNRAAQLVDRMEELGVISAAGHNGTREVFQQPGNAEGVVGDGAKDLPEGFFDVVEWISWVGVFGKVMLDKYDGPQARAIEKALIDEGLIGKDHYQGVHKVLADKPENVHETSLEAAERFVLNSGKAEIAEVTGLTPNLNELILLALEAKGVVSKPDASGKREFIGGPA